MSPIMLGSLCALAVGALASAYCWGVRRRRDESAAGIVTLSAMRWREFAGLIIAMFSQRGYTASERYPLASGDQSDFVLERDDGLCVVSCKHGSAYRLGSAAVDELANSVRMHDASGGIMVTLGSFAPDAYAQAKQHRIDLIDGMTLWPEIAPLVPQPLREQVEKDAAQRAKRNIALGWLAAAAVGVAVVLLPTGIAEAPAPAPAPAPERPTPVAAADAAKRDAAKTTLTAAPTEPQMEQRRRDAASAIAALPGIERAVWSTQSTLSLDMSDTRSDRWEGICDVLDSYQELRATRVQINPPPDSEAPVRFKQCHAY